MLPLKEVLINSLNRNLKVQGIYNIKVVGLSDDFQTARVVHDSGATGAVKAEILLPLDPKPSPGHSHRSDQFYPSPGP